MEIVTVPDTKSLSESGSLSLRLSEWLDRHGVFLPTRSHICFQFFSPVSGGPPERPVALTCVAQTGVVSPGGDEQATRYYPPSLIRARG